MKWWLRKKASDLLYEKKKARRISINYKDSKETSWQGLMRKKRALITLSMKRATQIVTAT